MIERAVSFDSVNETTHALFVRAYRQALLLAQLIF